MGSLILRFIHNGTWKSEKVESANTALHFLVSEHSQFLRMKRSDVLQSVHFVGASRQSLNSQGKRSEVAHRLGNLQIMIVERLAKGSRVEFERI